MFRLIRGRDRKPKDIAANSLGLVFCTLAEILEIPEVSLYQFAPIKLTEKCYRRGKLV
ncbi:MAG: hypothetical protein DF168_01526 [Candidatus Moanabacter tarae]|uniref:Uncharacterized protein n=1 Tax=Candidatus Moanibacter tarae TaxID=2200854 RepID=A0A2Z4AMI5_9BACT|nr:MAG: hypothetical protein DF168_01526 [Candidatus Moanabacter tarae]